MFRRILSFILLFSLHNLCAANLYAQPGIHLTPDSLQGVPGADRLFDDSNLLSFKLTGKCNELFNDRNSNEVIFHPMLLQYKRKDSSLVSIQLRVGTRGNFRRKKENCTLPPLLINFPRSKTGNTIFEKQNKLKLVMPCKGDEYVIREWLVYKLYNLITEKSFKARLVQVEFEDSLKKHKAEIHYCILLEDDKALAERNKCIAWNRTKVAMVNTDKDQFLKMAVFQYMIGNTDWSVPYLQNIKLIRKDSTGVPFTVPYDFDHAGIVNTPYALPAEELGMSSILERRYRGYCQANSGDYNEVIAYFNNLKNDLYKVYTGCALLNVKYLKFVTRYLDDFYKVINNRKAIETEFGHPCRQSTRVEIKGLKVR